MVKTLGGVPVALVGMVSTDGGEPSLMNSVRGEVAVVSMVPVAPETMAALGGGVVLCAVTPPEKAVTVDKNGAKLSAAALAAPPGLVSVIVPREIESSLVTTKLGFDVALHAATPAGPVKVQVGDADVEVAGGQTSV